jgi:predicted dehydrogenase
MMQANFSQYSSRYGRYLSGIVDPSFDPVCQGGALRDINIYNIHFAAALFGESLEGQYYPNIGFNGVDTSGVLVLKYDGFSAVCTAAKDSDSPCFVIVQGERGHMIMNSKPNAPSELTTFISGAEEKECCYKTKPCHRMTREFVDFAQMIRDKDHLRARYYEEETLAAMKILASIRIQ